MKKIVIATGAVFLLYIIVCVLLPDNFKVQHSIVVSTTQENAFAAVASFRNWQNWSPWQQKDSTMQVTYTGPETHRGAGMEWVSKKSGEGSMLIVDFKPYDYIKQDVNLHDFNKRWASEFTFIQEGDSTKVIWAESGELQFWERPFGFLYCKYINPDLEKGLSNMKVYLEK